MTNVYKVEQSAGGYIWVWEVGQPDNCMVLSDNDDLRVLRDALNVYLDAQEAAKQ